MQKLNKIEFISRKLVYVQIYFRMRTATSIDISKRLMNRETGMVALCRAIPICGYYDRRNPLTQDLFLSRFAVYVHR